MKRFYETTDMKFESMNRLIYKFEYIYRLMCTFEYTVNIYYMNIYLKLLNSRLAVLLISSIKKKKKPDSLIIPLCKRRQLNSEF